MRGPGPRGGAARAAKHGADRGAGQRVAVDSTHHDEQAVVRAVEAGGLWRATATVGSELVWFSSDGSAAGASGVIAPSVVARRLYDHAMQLGLIEHREHHRSSGASPQESKQQQGRAKQASQAEQPPEQAWHLLSLAVILFACRRCIARRRRTRDCPDAERARSAAAATQRRRRCRRRRPTGAVVDLVPLRERGAGRAARAPSIARRARRHDLHRRHQQSPR